MNKNTDKKIKKLEADNKKLKKDVEYAEMIGGGAFEAYDAEYDFSTFLIKELGDVPIRNMLRRLMRLEK